MDNSWLGLDRWNEVGIGRWRILSRQTENEYLLQVTRISN